jgi:hypothetical protein
MSGKVNPRVYEGGLGETPLIIMSVAERCVTDIAVDLAFNVSVYAGPPGLQPYSPSILTLAHPGSAETTLIGRRVLLGSFSCWGGEEVAGVGVGVICDVV